MDPITERDIRACFVNCSKGEAHRAGLPKDLADQPWEALDFLGWRDPGAPGRAYLVAERDGRLVGVALRAVSGGSRGFTARSMCSLCLTVHTGGGVALMTARRTGEAGRQGNTIGQYLCGDLACSLYVRGRRDAAVGGDLDESLTQDAKIARIRANLHAFLDKITQ
ncbi:FBP C-terminal treble-clef zinc-finger [Thermomonospora echinospora]|uniref:FBP C-terminal treble-clef zinc-finger n=1 Tax=Thermomonospora echinospora TaxID=1992 RepID=A0A1H6D8H3_9ACTN|nr:FBP domain-containing protein [Thermomonospora echinospora]SEG81727.1 FBP C-terminal treble-clef zinc-finger [Thermomonospora echinospora]